MKRFIAIILAIVTVFSLCATAGASGQIDARYTGINFKADGKSVIVDNYNIGGYGYYKLRDIAAMAVGTEKEFSVDWDDGNQMITLTSGKEYAPLATDLQPGDGQSKKATPSTAKLVIDGEEVSLTAYNIGGFNYFKLRDICEALDIGVVWDESTRTSGIATKRGYYDEQPQVVAAPESVVISNIGVLRPPTKTSLYIGQSTVLDVDILPASASSGIWWQSSDSSIVSVDDYGRVTAHKMGTVTITATTYNDKSDTFVIDVPYAPAELKYQRTADGEGYEIIGCDTGAYTVHIPANYNGLPVVSIKGGAFKDCANLRYFTMDAEQKTFYEEGGVIFTDIPEKTLVCFPPAYDAADYYYVPEGTVAIGSYAFAGLCSKTLRNITLQEGVVRLGDYAFAECNVITYIYTPVSLVNIGKDIVKGYYRNPYFLGLPNSAIERYAKRGRQAKWLDSSVHVIDYVLNETSAPESLEPSQFIPADEGMVLVDHSYNRDNEVYIGGREYHYDIHMDLTDLQKNHSGEIRVLLDARWSKLRPDVYGNTEQDLSPQTGLYGAGYTEGVTILRGYDMCGNLVAMQYVSGNFAFSFPGAYNLGVEGGQNTQLTVLPIEPVYIASAGSYGIELDKWNRLPDGNVCKYYILQVLRPVDEFDTPNPVSIIGRSLDAATGEATGGLNSNISTGFSVYRYKSSEPSTAHWIDGSVLSFEGMATLMDNLEFACMVNSDFTQTEGFATKLYTLLGEVKQTMSGVYFPVNVPVSKITVCGDGSLRAKATKGFIFSNKDTDIQTYAHEMVHAIDDYIEASHKVSPGAWMEGRAEYISMKVCEASGYKYTNQHIGRRWSSLSEEAKRDFARYYYFVNDEDTEYAMGYQFICYLNETYGEDISGKIMANIAALTEYDSTQRSEANFILFKQCVEDATEVGVFQNFVRDVIEK